MQVFDRGPTAARRATVVLTLSIAAALATPPVSHATQAGTPRSAVVAAEGTAAADSESTASPGPTTSSTSTPTGSTSADPSPTKSADPSDSDAGHNEPDHPEPLGGDLLKAQIAEAERIAGILESSTSEVATAMRRMDTLSDRSNDVLESLAAAKDTERAASQEAKQARADLEDLEKRLARSRALIKAWVFDVYSGGGGDSDVTGMLDAMEAEESAAGNPLGDLSYLTDQRTRALQEVRILTAEQVRLTTAAESAERAARTARAEIAEDKAELDALMETQRAKIGTLRKLQMEEVDKAGPVASILIGARTPEAKVAADRLRAALSTAVVETADVGKPCTDDTGVYPNGLFPDSALCPVWGAPGERLSPAAAASFSALSKAYAAQTGSPICITDSYRSLGEQVAIKGKRGRFAATPGTSRHGLGRALDLCGGIEDFGSAAHRWMRVNAPLYGFFHPAWAGAGGSLPEPWHWEFSG